MDAAVLVSVKRFSDYRGAPVRDGEHGNAPYIKHVRRTTRQTVRIYSGALATPTSAGRSRRSRIM
jgi:hypothetical protein